jgi:hypothetical protein
VCDVVVLTLDENVQNGCAGGRPLRVPVLACRDALHAAGARVEPLAVDSDAGIDAVLDRLPAARLVVAAAADGQLRAVVRRLVRRYAPPPSARPADLPADRTVADLPPFGVLPMGAALPARLALPREAVDVAAAVLDGRVRRFDLLRNDGGSVTLHAALLGAADGDGAAVPFAARVEVDDAVLADGSEGLIAAAVANAGGYTDLDGLALTPAADPADGLLDAAVALPRRRRGRVEIEVRRARGRAAAVTPHGEVRLLDDGVRGALARKRSWWVERGALGVYCA